MVARIIKQKIQEHLEKEECGDSLLAKVMTDYDL